MRSRDEILLKLDELRRLKQLVTLLKFEGLRTNIDDWIAALEWVLGLPEPKEQEVEHASQ